MRVRRLSLLLPSLLFVVFCAGAGLAVLTLGALGGRSAAQGHTAGDVNGDGVLDLSDPVYLLRYLFAGGPAPVPCTQCAPGRVIFVVRHAEKASGGSDPGLTEQGYARAERLKEVFSRTQLEAVFASEKRRTQETAQPTAEDHGLGVIAVDQVNDLAELLSRLGDLRPGARALVVGHSYTIDDIFRGLGIADPPVISTSVYDYFFVLFLPVEESGEPLLVQLRYL